MDPAVELGVAVPVALGFAAIIPLLWGIRWVVGWFHRIGRSL